MALLEVIWLPLHIVVFHCYAADLVTGQMALRLVGPIDILMTFHKHGTAWDSMVKKKWTAQTHKLMMNNRRTDHSPRNICQDSGNWPSPGYSSGVQKTFCVAQTKVCYTYTGQPSIGHLSQGQVCAQVNPKHALAQEGTTPWELWKSLFPWRSLALHHGLITPGSREQP